MNDFHKELTAAINRCCMENGSNTPDFILAVYLSNCLAAFDIAVQQRENWYGRDPRPSMPFGRDEEPTLHPTDTGVEHEPT